MSEIKYVDSVALAEFWRLAKNEITKMAKQQIVDLVYPVGSIYMSFENKDPSIIFPNTVWSPIEGRFLIAANDKYLSGDYGGQEKLTEDQLPRISGTLGSGVGTAKPAENKLGEYGVFRSASGHFKFVDGMVAKYTYDRKDASTIGDPQPYQQVTYSFGKNVSEQLPALPPYVAVYMWRRIENGSDPVETFTLDQPLLDSNDILV